LLTRDQAVKPTPIPDILSGIALAVRLLRTAVWGRVGRDGRIGVRMNRSGVTQEELSRRSGCTQQFLSEILNGRRRWPEGMLGRAKTHLNAKEGQV